MLLSVKNLSVSFKNKDKVFNIIKKISFDLPRGEVLGLVGESGSGKSVTGFSIMRLLNDSAATINGEILIDGKNILLLSQREMDRLRGNEISMIYQEPMTALNPLLTIERQIAEVVILHKNYNKHKARQRVIELLELVKMPNPIESMKKYPHELSGGQRQRVVIAMAIACNPKLIIADEPTTALDVTVQKEILSLLIDIKDKMGTSIIFITHDLGVVSEIADRIIVLYGGKILEDTDVKSFFNNPSHPYSVGLIKSRPALSSGTRLYSIGGIAINPREEVVGCNFYKRCEHHMDKCLIGEIPMINICDNHKVRCLLHSQEG